MTVASINPGPLSLIGTALQAQLQVAFPPSYFEFSFMPPRLTAQEWERLVRRTPFIGLGWNDIDATNNGGSLFKGESHWTVFAVVTNQASVGGRYYGDQQGVGLFQVLQAAIAVLNGFTIKNVGTCLVKKVSNAYAEGWNKENIAMAAIDVAVNLTLSPAATLVGPEMTPGTFKQLGIDWMFSPDGAVVLADLFNIRPQE